MYVIPMLYRKMEAEQGESLEEAEQGESLETHGPTSLTYAAANKKENLSQIR